MRLDFSLQQKRAGFPALQLTFIVFDIFHNIAHFAVQDTAKHLNGMGADALVTLQSGDLRRTDIVFLNEGILGNPFFPHDIPQVVVRNHNIQASLSTWMLTEDDV